MAVRKDYTNLDDLFLDEFNVMLNQLSTQRGVGFNLLTDKHLVPDFLLNDTYVLDTHVVQMNNITEEYYSLLNGCTGLYYPKASIEKRIFDTHTEDGYAHEDDGKYKYEHVTVPNECIAILTEHVIGVPNVDKTKPNGLGGYKPYQTKEEGFAYIDFLEKPLGNQTKTLYIYIIPKKYCYMVNQSALVLRVGKAERSRKTGFYVGKKIALSNGLYVYMYIEPYNPKKHYTYKVVATSTHPDNLLSLWGKIYKYWIENGIAFNPKVCDVSNGTKGVLNTAYTDIEGTLTEYVFVHDRAMDNTTELDILYDSGETETDTPDSDDVADISDTDNDWGFTNLN